MRISGGMQIASCSCHCLEPLDSVEEVLRHQHWATEKRWGRLQIIAARYLAIFAVTGSLIIACYARSELLSNNESLPTMDLRPKAESTFREGC